MYKFKSKCVMLKKCLDKQYTIQFDYLLGRASGHVDRFADFMVKDLKTGECFRADKLLAEHIERLLADPKCPIEKKEEYNTVLRKVREYQSE